MSHFPETNPLSLRPRLISLDRAMQKAMTDRDAAAYAGFLSDDYVLVDAKGQMHDKGAVLRNLADPALRIETNESCDHHVRLYGNTAVVIAELQQRGFEHGQPYDMPVRFTDLWLRRRGRWVCVSAHASPLQRAG